MSQNTSPKQQQQQQQENKTDSVNVTTTLQLKRESNLCSSRRRRQCNNKHSDEHLSNLNLFFRRTMTVLLVALALVAAALAAPAADKITNLPGQPAVKFAQYAVREKELTDRCSFFFFFFFFFSCHLSTTGLS
jgi:hypothetical protein